MVEKEAQQAVNSIQRRIEAAKKSGDMEEAKRLESIAEVFRSTLVRIMKS